MKTVQTLQLKILDSKVSVSELLRNAYYIACKLNLNDFKKWLHSEMYGYAVIDGLPDYRFIQGTLFSFNDFQGWRSIGIHDKKISELFNRIAIQDKISEIEYLIKHSEDTQFIQKELPPENRKWFAERAFGRVVIRLPEQQLAGILDTVRNKILEWALNLEQEEVPGKDMSFNEQEQERATTNVTYNNIVNNSVIHAPFQQGYNNDMRIEDLKHDLEIARELIDEVKSIANNFDDQDKAELQADLDTIESQIKSPKPKIHIIKSTFSSIKNVIEGAMGSSIANLPTVVDSFNNLVNRINVFVGN